MALRSMTGFARCEGSHGQIDWYWELRSVNGRGLDVRLRLPPGSERLEAGVRQHIQAALKRGSVTAGLTVQKQAGAAAIRLNEDVLDQVLAAAEKVKSRVGGDLPSVASLLGVKGVLEVVEAEDEPADLEARDEAILQSLESALADLISEREKEGGRLADVVRAQISEIERLVGEIENSPVRTPEAIGEKLAEQVAKLRGADKGLDEERLHQEAALLATRSDVEEEIKRLHAHVAAARDLLKDGGAVGRKLDFLTQEFNRESNTICSKSGDVATTRNGLALKAVVDQMREQVQNVE